jgi:hypothetical protein
MQLEDLVKWMSKREDTEFSKKVQQTMINLRESN